SNQNSDTAATGTTMDADQPKTVTDATKTPDMKSTLEQEIKDGSNRGFFILLSFIVGAFILGFGASEVFHRFRTITPPPAAQGPSIKEVADWMFYFGEAFALRESKSDIAQKQLLQSRSAAEAAFGENHPIYKEMSVTV